MPIAPFLNGERFDLETRRVMGVAFEMTCVALQIADADNRAHRLIATRIIKLAKAWERNPDLLVSGR
jgi:hypothetical protein